MLRNYSFGKFIIASVRIIHKLKGKKKQDMRMVKLTVRDSARTQSPKSEWSGKVREGYVNEIKMDCQTESPHI